MLEWGWIKGKTRQLFKGSWKPALGTICAAAVLLPFVFWLFLPKNAPEYYEFGFGRGQGRGQAWEASQDRRLPDPGDVRDQPGDPAPGPGQRGRESQPPAPPPSGGERRPAEKAPGEEEHEARLVSGYQESGSSAFVITGRMTLRQVEAETGIPVERILVRMGLPGNVSRDEALGRIRRRHGFTLADLRTAVEALMEKK